MDRIPLGGNRNGKGHMDSQGADSVVKVTVGTSAFLVDWLDMRGLHWTCLTLYNLCLWVSKASILVNLGYG